MRRIICFVLSISLAWAPSSSAQYLCGTAEQRIMDALSENGCRRDADCAAMQLPPPLGCNVPVNKDAVPAVEEALQEYRLSCRPLLYNCMVRARSLRCAAHRCEVAGIITGVGPSNTTLDEHGRPLRR